MKQQNRLQAWVLLVLYNTRHSLLESTVPDTRVLVIHGCRETAPRSSTTTDCLYNTLFLDSCFLCYDRASRMVADDMIFCNKENVRMMYRRRRLTGMNSYPAGKTRNPGPQGSKCKDPPCWVNTEADRDCEAFFDQVRGWTGILYLVTSRSATSGKPRLR